MSEDDPCEFCTARNLHCKKTWGPKRGTCTQNLQLVDPTISLSAYPVSLIADANLSGQEVFYLRHSHAIQSRSPLSPDGAIFIHLWNEYGLTLSSEILRCAVIAGVILEFSITCQTTVPAEYFLYLSRVHQKLLLAFQQKKFDESHLFASYLTVMNAAVYTKFFEPEATHSAQYHEVFLGILEELNNQAKCRSSKFPLQHVWKSALSWIWNSIFSRTIISIEERERQHLPAYLLMSKLSECKGHLEIAASIAGSRVFSPYSPLYSDVRDVLGQLKAALTISCRSEEDPFKRREMFDTNRAHLSGAIKCLEQHFNVFSNLCKN